MNAEASGFAENQDGDGVGTPRRRPAFTVIPAIDLKDGCCVRLRQGLASEKTVYSENPAQMACHWESQGAKMLHVVDLDGAFQGRPAHTELIGRIARAVSIPVQAGGGLRTAEQIRELLELGVSRAIIGTSACMAVDEMANMASEFGGKLAAAIDARDGFVRIKGWTQTAPVHFLAAAARIAGTGVKTIIYTNTAADGMLDGPDVGGVAAVCKEVDCDVIASGGISSVEDIAKLRDIRAANLVGAIVGKALYDGRVSLGRLTE